MIADLHIHSYYSDGTQSPEEIVEEAKHKGIGIISICDHNTIESFHELKIACDREGLGYVNGVEIDCLFDDTGLLNLAGLIDVM